MSVQETNGYLDVENATLRSSKVEVTSNLGIANTNPQHAFSVGSNLFIDTESSNVLTIKGNVLTEGVKMGFIEITPSYDFAAVSNVGNVTANTIIFTNDKQGFVATGNATIGSTLTVSGFRITAAAAAEDDLEAVTAAGGKTEYPIHIEGATTATSYTTGILQVGNSTNRGGMGVAGNVYVNQGVYTQDFSVENVVSNLAVNTDDFFVDIENSRVGIGKTEPTVALDVVGAVTASGALTVGSNTAVNTDDLFVDTVNSRVGIGKTEPTVALDVVGAVTASGDLTVTGTSKVGIGTDTLDAVLNVGTGTPTSGDQILKLNTDSPWAFEHETDGLGFRASTANKKLYIQSSDFSNVATFDVTGNKVGIGLTDPVSNLHVMGDIIGRNVSNTHTITGSDGGADTFTLLPDQNRVVVTHVGSSTLDGAYTVNMTGGIPTTIGSILYLEIVSSKTNTDTSAHTHSTTLQIAAVTVLTTGSISVAAANNAGDVYERTLRRTIILTSDGWKDYSVYPKLSVPTTDDAIIFSTTENTTQDTAGSDKPLVERLRITGNGNVGIGTDDPGAKMDIYTGSTGTVGLSFDRFASGNYRTDIYQNTYGPDFRVGYDTYTPESVLYLKRFSDGRKEVEINGNVGIGTNNPGKKLEISDGYQSLGGYIDTYRVSGVVGGTVFGTRQGGGTYLNALYINDSGNVGIGKNDPSYPLDVNNGGRIESFYTGPNNGYWTKMFIGASHPDGYTRLYFRTQNDVDAVTIYAASSSFSDDRLKTDEVLVTGATDTLMKLSVQKYKKYDNFQLTGNYKIETGLIAQDIWYNAPELRHIIDLSVSPDDILPLPEGTSTEDIQNDPDYTALGWGEDQAGVLYAQLIPYLIKSNQEQEEKIQQLQTKLQNVLVRLEALETGGG